MKPIVVTRSIAAPPQRVWESITDFEHAADRISGIKSCEVLTDGPVGVGTRFRETRAMFGKEATEEMEIVEFEPPSHYTVQADSCGMHYRSEMRVAPDGGGSRLEMHMGGTPTTTMAKLMSPIMGRLFAGAARKAIAKDLDDIAAHCEA